MSGLKGQTVATTYEGLIKTSNSAPIDVTPVTLSDGAGNLLPMEVGTQGINWSGDQDFTNATVIGLTVPPGPTGAQGAQGVEGAQGATGAQGIEGAQGAIGATGAQGIEGAQGAQGETGAQGDVGAKGEIGVTGAQGITGAQGVTGAQGIEGAQGAKGEVGATGAQGDSGNSAGATYYFNQSQNSEILPYKVLASTPSGNTQQTVLQTGIGAGTTRLMQEFITPELGFAVIPGGNQAFHFHFLKDANANQFEAYATLQLANSAGVPYGPILTSGPALITWLDASTPVEVTSNITIPTTTISSTDRMIVKIYVTNIGSGSHPVTFYTEGTQYYSFVVTSVGVVGNKGATGAQGAQGDTGPTGAQGITGAQGAVGPIDSTGPVTINHAWSGSAAQYAALGTYDASTIYFVV